MPRKNNIIHADTIILGSGVKLTCNDSKQLCINNKSVLDLQNKYSSDFILEKFNKLEIQTKEFQDKFFIDGTFFVKGPPGRDGLNGKPGKNGKNGVDGRSSIPGQRGQMGIPGKNGKSIQGPPGPQGVKGDRGPRGEQGLRGPKATVFDSIPDNRGGNDTLLLHKSDGSCFVKTPATRQDSIILLTPTHISNNICISLSTGDKKDSEGFYVHCHSCNNKETHQVINFNWLLLNKVEL